MRESRSDPVIHENYFRVSIVDDPRRFVWMEPVVDRHGGRAAAPDRIEDLKVFHAIGHDHGDAISGCTTKRF